MGFFERFKTKQSSPTFQGLPEDFLASTNPYKGKYSENGIENAVYLLYCDCSATSKWIKDAVKPDVFFDNYQKTLYILQELNKYTGKYRFRAPTPLQQINELCSEYTANTNNFIQRYWQATFASAQKLKTEKGRNNRIQQFFDTLLVQYRKYLFEDNIVLINHFKESNTTVKAEKIIITYKHYDMNSVSGIQAIPTTDTEAMRALQKCATDHKRNHDINLAIACLRKSNEISDNNVENKLLEKEYLRILQYIKLLKEPSLLQAEENAIKRKHPEFWDKRVSNKKMIQENIKQYTQMGVYLVTVQGDPACPICAAYQNKVYSIGKRHRKYPPLPDEIIQQTHPCKKHHMCLSGFYEGITTLNPISPEEEKKMERRNKRKQL